MERESSIALVKIEAETKALTGIIEKLEGVICREFDKGIEQIDADEMGKVVDMLKDVCKAKEKAIKGCYYKSIIEAMEEAGDEDMEDFPERYYGGRARGKDGRFTRRRGYSGNFPHDINSMNYFDDRDMDREHGRMYYSAGRSSGMGSGNMQSAGNGYAVRDAREGRSGQARRGYMESKESGKGHEHKKRELERYMRELSDDITEMITGSSEDEKEVLREKLRELTDKVS